MKIGILGAGKVGTTLGRGLARAGHHICYSARDPEDSKYEELRAEGATVLSVPEVVAATDLVILAAPWAASEAVLGEAGSFEGKPLLDATNPIGPGFTLTHAHTDSGGEQVQRWAPDAKVVKIFNSTGFNNMAAPEYPGGRATMFACGDDDEACAVAKTVSDDLGFETVVVGKLAKARLLEPLAILWIGMSFTHGREFAFGLLRRDPG